MKFVSIITLFLCISFLSYSQESVFYGFFEAREAKLVPSSENGMLNKSDKIIPNFKGRELVQLNHISQHYPEWNF